MSKGKTQQRSEGNALEQAAQQAAIRDLAQNAEEADDSGAPERPADFVRKPFGSQRQKLAYPARPGFRRYWFNDEPGRIEEAVSAGYTHVKDKKGKPVKHTVGVKQNGGGLIAFLMEIPQDWFEDDMRAQQRRIDEIDAAIMHGQVANKRDEDKRYVPRGGIKYNPRGTAASVSGDDD